MGAYKEYRRIKSGLAELFQMMAHNIDRDMNTIEEYDEAIEASKKITEILVNLKKTSITLYNQE